MLVECNAVRNAKEQVFGGNKYVGYESLFPFRIPRTMQRLATTWASDYRGDLAFQLLKLHGSLNWFHADSGRGDVIYDAGGISTDDDAPADFASLSSDWVGLRPLLIPPMATKASNHFNGMMEVMWRNAREAAVNADRMICVGYSLPPTDWPMRMLLKGRQATPREWVVVNCTKDPEGVFSHYRAVDLDAKFDTSFTSDAAVVEKFVEAYVGSAFDAKPV